LEVDGVDVRWTDLSGDGMLMLDWIRKLRPAEREWVGGVERGENDWDAEEERDKRGGKNEWEGRETGERGKRRETTTNP